MTHDLVIRNGLVVDGTGQPAFRGDVAVDGRSIVAVGTVEGRGRREVDADGHVVTPGFIDGHTHLDAQIMWDGLGTSSCWHGITTAVFGNCGFTLAPVRRGRHELLVRNFDRAEDIPAAVLDAALDWSWETFPQYLDVLDEQPKGINVAAQIGHSALRTWAMGERAFEAEKISDADFRVMAAQLRAALRAGAVGFSTSRSDNHETSDGRPVASRFATWAEVQALVGVVGRESAAVFELALEPGARALDAAERREFADRLARLVVESGAPCTFGVQPTRADGTDWRDQLRMIDATVAAGGNMFGQSHSRGISVVMSFATRLPFDALEPWAAVRQRPWDEQRALLADPAVQQRLVAAGVDGNYPAAIGAESRPPDPERIFVLDAPLPPYRSLADVASERRISPVQAMIELLLQSDFQRMFLQPLTESDPDVLLEIMRHPRTVMTFSDAGAHVSQIIDASIHTHLLAHWVRDRQALSLEQAVAMMTSAAARAWRFHDRGVLRAGMAADVNVFDPAVVGPAMPRVEFDLPSGAPRLTQRSTGFLATVVGGRVLIEEGVHTGDMPGRLLRGGRDVQLMSGTGRA